MMEFNLHTYDIQYLVIALISYKSDSVLTEADIKRLIDNLSMINNLCTKDNNYTLSITVNDKI